MLKLGKNFVTKINFFTCKSCVPGISVWAEKMAGGGEGGDGEIGEDAAAAAAAAVVAAAVVVVVRRGIRGGDGE